MSKIQENNVEVLDFINAKLVKDYTKLAKKINKSPKEEKILNALELGTPTNKKIVYSSFGPFVSLLGVGFASVGVGLISIIPLADQTLMKNVTEKAVEMGNFGSDAIKFGGDMMHNSLYLALIPLGVTSLSVSVTIYQMLRESRNNKNNYNHAMIQYIDDIINNKEDDTLEFSKTFFKRVDLSSLLPKENLKLIKYLTYHRYILKHYKEGNATKEDVDDAYSNVILYLEELRDSFKSKNDLKNNRFVNLLIEEYHNKEKEDIILGRNISK